MTSSSIFYVVGKFEYLCELRIPLAYIENLWGQPDTLPCPAMYGPEKEGSRGGIKGRDQGQGSRGGIKGRDAVAPSK